MAAKQKLADVQCTRMKFEPGDKLIVRVRHTLHPDQRKNLKRGVQKWDGEGVGVMIVEVPLLDIEVEKQARGAGQ